MLPEKTERFRVAHRVEIGPRYDGRLHFATLNVVLPAVILGALSQVSAPTAREIAVVPIAFVIANLAEYLGHRFPMHRAMWPLERLCHRHAGMHHRFFTHLAMRADSHRDWAAVLFPPVLLLFFLGGIATPIGVALFAFSSSNTGSFFVATAAGYFLLYEWLHLAYHQPDDSFVGRRAIVRLLRRHHMTHHDPSRMTRVNFNITFPICDLVFGTAERAHPVDVTSASEPDGAEVGPRSETGDTFATPR